MLGNICKQSLNSLAFWGEMEYLAFCWHVLSAMCLLLVKVGHPYPRKTCKLEQYPGTLLLCVVSEQRGLDTACREAPLLEKSSCGHQCLFGSWGVLVLRNPVPLTCRSSEERRCAKLHAVTTLRVCRLLQCRQKSLINCHYKM